MNSDCMRRFCYPLMFLAALPASAQQPAWHLFAHDDGCVDLNLLVKAEKLPRAPVSPEDFARMMRERGEQVVVGPPPGFPPELAGKVVQVKVGEWKAPVFVRDEVCRKLDAGRR